MTALLLLLAAAAGPDAPLATLGPRVLRESDFRAHVAATAAPAGAPGAASHPAARRAAIEAWLDAVALAARGRQLGIDREPRFVAARALARERLLVQLAAERHRDALRGAPVTEAELRRERALHGDGLRDDPRFTGRHLLVYVEGNPAFPERGRPDGEARARAQAALARLRAGDGWDAVARAWSDEPGTRARGGRVRDARLAHLAPEVQRAVRTQPPGVPGAPFRSALGWHVLEVEARARRPSPPPPDALRDLLVERIAGRRAAAAREALLARARREVGLRVRDDGRRGATIPGPPPPPGAVLAEIDGREVREAELRLFVDDAFLPAQRAGAWARPGARAALLDAFLDQRVLAAWALREGLDRTRAFARRLALAEDALLAGFTEAREGGGPPGLCTAGGPGREGARRVYLDRTRAAVGLRVAASGG